MLEKRVTRYGGGIFQSFVKCNNTGNHKAEHPQEDIKSRLNMAAINLTNTGEKSVKNVSNRNRN